MTFPSRSAVFVAANALAAGLELLELSSAADADEEPSVLEPSTPSETAGGMLQKYLWPSCAVMTTAASGDMASVAKSSSDNGSAVSYFCGFFWFFFFQWREGDWGGDGDDERESWDERGKRRPGVCVKIASRGSALGKPLSVAGSVQLTRQPGTLSCDLGGSDSKGCEIREGGRVVDDATAEKKNTRMKWVLRKFLL